MRYFFLYILKCNDDSYYVGHTDDIDRRLDEHVFGKIKTCYTYKRRPIELVFTDGFSTRDEAFFAERQIKKWTRKKKEALIKQNWNQLSKLAKKKFK
jgi:predicted GIY-YIG superfamily endonuclease